MSGIKDKGGRIAANFRRANVAEGLAIDMVRPFAAVAPVPREEDYGIDLIATLLEKDGRVLVARESFVVQIKTHTSPRFEFSGAGIQWLRDLTLPYFPLIINLDEAKASLYTLNEWHRVIHPSIVQRYVFCPEPDELDDFYLGDPLMEWTLAEAAQRDFPAWAYSVLRPAVEIETRNQFYAPMWRFEKIEGANYRFEERGDNGLAQSPPAVASVDLMPPGDKEAIWQVLESVLDPFANRVMNEIYDEFPGDKLMAIRDLFRELGVEPDPNDRWQDFVDDFRDYYDQSSPAA